MDMVEGPKLDLGRLIGDLKEVTDWFQLGFRLGIKHTDLKIIESNYKHEGIERCKTEMLAFWQSNFESATLSKLATALEEIDFRDLAQRLQEEYTITQKDHISRQCHLVMQVTEPHQLLNPSSDCSKKRLHAKCIINQLDKDVRREYARFTADLQTLFERKGVSVNDAIYVFAHLDDESALTSDMRKAEDIQKFLLALKHTQSWYNFKTTASLAELLGGDEGNKLVETYEAKLKVHFRKRRKSFTTKTRQFVVKVDDKRERFTEEKIVEFRNTIVRLMNLKHKDLILKSIEDGCVELTYLFPSTLASTIKSAIGACINELKEQRVISVSIDGEVLWYQSQPSEELKRAQLSPTDSGFLSQGQQHPVALLPVSSLSTASRSLYPHTTRSPALSCSGVDLSGIHFVDSLKVITCGPPGGIFHSKSNNVTITIPVGAVPSDMHSINIEFGVALLGPFDMPSSDVKPVSPFIWIYIEAKEFEFSKPITIILPHFISCDTEQDCEALTFMKADYRYIDEEGKFLFRKCDRKSKFRPHSMKGTLVAQHSCFVCITSKVPSTTISNANYCLMMAMPSRQDARFEVTFCITYLLETCMEVVSRQFSGDDFRIQRKQVKLASPKVTPGSVEEAEIRIEFQSNLGGGWVAANMSGHWEIPISEIAFWNRNIDELRLLNHHKMYPPRFVIDVNGTSATRASCLTVEFTGLRRRVQFQITLSSSPDLLRGLRKPVHPLDRHILEINQYLNIGLIRMSLRSRGAFTDEEMDQLVDLSIRGLDKATIIETLMKYIKSKGDEGMINFKLALEETRDGTGHETILQILNENEWFNEAEKNQLSL